MSSQNGIPQVEQRPEGFILQDESDTAKAALATMGMAGCFIFVPVVVGGFMIVAAFSSSGSALPGVMAVLFVGVFLLVGVAILTSGLKKLRVSQQWEPGELISPSWPIRPGHPVELQYRRHAKTADSPDCRSLAAWSSTSP